MINVVNKRTHTPTPNDIYIGRGSALGNPYTGSKKLASTKAEFQVDSREDAIYEYLVWINDKIDIKDKAVCFALNQIYLKALKGPVNLVCYCSPLPCHGDKIKSIVERALAMK